MRDFKSQKFIGEGQHMLEAADETKQYHLLFAQEIMQYFLDCNFCHPEN